MFRRHSNVGTIFLTGFHPKLKFDLVRILQCIGIFGKPFVMAGLEFRTEPKGCVFSFFEIFFDSVTNEYTSFHL